MDFYLPEATAYTTEAITSRNVDMIGYFNSVENKIKKLSGEFTDVTTTKKGGFTGISASFDIDTAHGCVGAPIFSDLDRDNQKFKCHCHDNDHRVP